MSDLLLENVRLPSGEETHLRIEGGVIREVSPRARPTAGMAREDGGGLLVLPGGIDMHVHFRTPGGEHKETLVTGGRAAVKGGITTCADMPNSSPRTTTVAALREKAALGREAPCNLLFNFGAEPDNLAEVRAAAGHPQVKALKIYLGPSTGQGGLAPAAAAEHFRQAGALGLPVMVHAEDMDIIAADDGRYPHDARHHGDLRSLAAELAAVDAALALARAHGVRLYLAHVTSARVVERAAASGLAGAICTEVCPHHLLLATEDIAPPLENRYKVNPPLRPEAERAALMAQLPAGIDVLGSDHAPHTLAEKEAPYDEAPSGIPGVEYLYPLAIDWWRRGRITLERLLALTSGNAARFFGLTKGALAPGADADLVLVDPDAEWVIGAGDDRVASKCGWTLYGGRRLRGRIERTLVAGRVVWRRGG